MAVGFLPGVGVWHVVLSTLFAKMRSPGAGSVKRHALSTVSEHRGTTQHLTSYCFVEFVRRPPAASLSALP